jgi:hypothetical protein
VFSDDTVTFAGEEEEELEREAQSYFLTISTTTEIYLCDLHQESFRPGLLVQQN